LPALDEHCLNIYTDGSCKPRPRRGGLAYRFVLVNEETGYEEPINFKLGCFMGSTNNQMEMLACIEALKTALKDSDILPYLHSSKKVVIYTDSAYIQEHYQLALYEWKSNDWQRAGGATVLNVGLWEALNKLRARLYRVAGKRLSFEKVKAHQKGSLKDPHNEVVDKLAKEAADCKTKCKCDLIPYVDVRKKNSSQKVLPGSVRVNGQTVEVFIVTDRVIKKGSFLLCYKIIQSGNLFFDCVDYAQSNLPLRAGHYYLATFNKNNKNPMIVEATEVEKPTIESGDKKG
jgi:ribonuclease HI